MGEKALPRAHYVPANHSSRVPSRHIYFDTESNIDQRRTEQIQTWKLGVAAFDRRVSNDGRWLDRQWCRADTPEQLWAWIDSHATAKGRTVVWAHNLAYDLRVSAALRILPDLGWRLDRLRLATRDATARFVRDKASLTLTDLHSWAPTSLADVAKMLSVPYVPLPAGGAPIGDWWSRCENDVEILGSAVRTLLEWQRVNDVGNWQPTGAGQAWSTWRHKHLTHPVLVHDDDEARRAEREAVHAGRCEVWRHGTYSRTKLTEMDWSTAYAQVCRDVALPTRLESHYGMPRMSRVHNLIETRRVLSRVKVRTDYPVLPARVNGRLCWPVGEYVTSVWDNELNMALAAGADIQVLECWSYRADKALAQWAQWCLDIVNADGGPGHPLIRMAIKQQSRTLVGRFGLRYPEWERYGAAGDDGASLGILRSPEYPNGTQLLHVGRDLLAQTGMREGQNAAPAILGYVMAEVRTRLWGWMLAAGLENVSYVDTDGLIVTPRGLRNLQANNPDGLRSKGTYARATFRGPRQLTLAGKHRISGVPAKAETLDGVKFHYDAWETLSGALSRGRGDSVRVYDRVVRIKGTDYRRRHLVGGFTEPFRVSITEGTLANRLAA